RGSSRQYPLCHGGNGIVLREVGDNGMWIKAGRDVPPEPLVTDQPGQQYQLACHFWPPSAKSSCSTVSPRCLRSKPGRTNSAVFLVARWTSPDSWAIERPTVTGSAGRRRGLLAPTLISKPTCLSFERAVDLCK